MEKVVGVLWFDLSLDKGLCFMIEEILLGLPFSALENLLWQTSFSALLWGVWLKRNSRIFRCVERSCDEL